MLKLSGYKLLELLSQERAFMIYRGLRVMDKQKVILKICRTDPDLKQELSDLQHEYQIIKRLNLANIIKVYELFVSDDQLILVLEDVVFPTLQEYLQNTSLTLEDFFKIALEIVDVISALHLQHIIHKDINSKNIYINPQTLQIKLADLTHASQINEEVVESLQIRHLGERLAYLSPEQTGRMNHPVDYRTDFYSLGILFYEMLTRELPFHSSDPLEMIHSHLAKIPNAVNKINKKVPEQLATLIAKLLAKVPEERYASAIGLKADLQECQAQWLSKKKIDYFPLGEQDIYDSFSVSQKLYGRELQLDELITIFRRVSEGATEFLLISGYSGIGKTSLVKELYKPITQHRGYFVSGKFDQLQKNTPYSAIIDAFQNLVRKLLVEPENYLEQIKQTLLNALGNNGQVIIDVIPTVALIIGPQPPVAQLSPTEAQNRFMLTLQNFIHALAQAEHPLVIFLDDLQWVDNASLTLIESLLADNELKYFLLIGAYRNNEVSTEHPLLTSLQHIKTLGVLVTNMTLLPLTKMDIQHLLADSFICQAEDTESLATILLNKTNGNPFFINQFLKLLYDKNLLGFDYTARCWLWDIVAIKKEPITENVVDLLVFRIQQLPDTTQNILRLAACIGHTFDLLTLTTICELTTIQTMQGLYEAIIVNLIAPLEDTYRTASIVETIALIGVLNPATLRYQFLHDRIQQAAYQLIEEEKTEQIHLQVGRLLLKQSNLHENDHNLFEIVNHFVKSLDLITDVFEQKQVALYCLWAGRKAKASTAYYAAKKYLYAGLKLLSSHKNNNDQLLFEIEKELAVCLYLTGNFDDADKKFAKLASSPLNKIEKIEVYTLYCEMLSTLNKHQEAVEKGLGALKLVGIALPNNPNKLQIFKAVLTVKFRLHWQNAQNIDLLPVTKPEYKAAMDLISKLLNSAFIVNQPLFLLLACTNINLSLRYGYTASTSFACLVYAFIVIHALGLYKDGFNFVELYKKISNQLSVTDFAGKNHFVLGAFIYPWRYSISDSIEMVELAFRNSYEVGDLSYGTYSQLFLVLLSFFAGHPLTNVQRKISNLHSFIDKVKTEDFLDTVLFYEYMMRCLANKNAFDLDQLKYFEDKIIVNNNKTELEFFYSLSIKLCFLSGFYDAVQSLGPKQEALASYNLGFVSSMETIFYVALSILHSCKHKSTLTFRQKKNLNKALKKIQRWNDWCHATFSPYFYLLKAEMFRLADNPFEAINFYNKALSQAQALNALHLIGIINEFAGRFYSNAKLPEFAKLHFQKSHSAFEMWGGFAKCALLRSEYVDSFITLPIKTELAQPQLTELSAAQHLHPIDILSILKAAQAISSEIRLEKLLQKLLFILLQNAGAQRGVLIIKEAGEWYIEAEGSVNLQRVYLTHSQKITERKDMPVTLINYVQRTHEKLLLQNRQQMEVHYANDNYLQEVAPHSILILPIHFQNQLRCLLYLENRDASYAFTQTQVETVQLLASQAAISLENAHLYYQATHDPLTGLANRNLLYQVFNQAITRAKRHNRIIAILFLDIDNFKKINDTMGHEIGDKILVYFAQQLRACLRDSDLAARLGGDEFIVMLEDVVDVNQVNQIAQRFLQQFSEHVRILDHDIYISTSIGISLYPINGTDIQELLKQADISLYRVKSTGKGRHEFYTSELNARLREENAREIELRYALEKQQFTLYYQPIFTQGKRELTHFEALLRWNHPTQGLLSANDFFPMIEKSNLILAVGEWVLRTVCRQIKAWQALELEMVPIAVNVSGQQFKQQEIKSLIASICKEESVNPELLELEFTETVFIDQSEEILQDIRGLKDLNIRLSIDDFGTYYSSLSYLKRLRIDSIKIDRSFISDITENSDSQAIVLAIIAMAHSLKLRVIAEGVETLDQLIYLEKIGVDELQGYYLGKPIPPPLALQLLRDKHLKKIYEQRSL